MSKGTQDQAKLSREDLYARIWAKPVRTVAAELGISDVGLAKICRRLDVPRPGPSYWGRLQHGQTPEKVPLPPKRDGVPDEVEIRPRSPSVSGPTEPAFVVPPPTNLDAPHAVVRALQKLLRGKEPNSEGLLLVSGKEEWILRVGSDTVERALLIYDGLFNALEGRGHRIAFSSVTEKGHVRTSLDAVVSGTSIELSLSERLMRSDHVLTTKELADKARSGYSWAPRHDFAPSGRLSLLVGGKYGVGHRSWNDGQRNKIETMLGDIVVGLEQAVREIQENDRRKEESRRQSALAERRRWHEDALGKDLDSMVERWTKATRIRGFLAAVEEGAPAKLREHEAFGRWLAWAKARADGLDPLAKPAEIAKVVDRDLLDE